jgi:Domain of unknown function (DUF4286)
MLLYNITTKVDHHIVENWIEWQNTVYIPEIMNTGFFSSHHFYRLLDHDDHEGSTFVLQFETSSRDAYDTYLKDFAPLLKQKVIDRWGEKTISFRTLLEPVDKPESLNEA